MSIRLAIRTEAKNDPKNCTAKIQQSNMRLAIQNRTKHEPPLHSAPCMLVFPSSPTIDPPLHSASCMLVSRSSPPLTPRRTTPDHGRNLRNRLCSLTSSLRPLQLKFTATTSHKRRNQTLHLIQYCKISRKNISSPVKKQRNTSWSWLRDSIAQQHNTA
jgi:hypothetical protein